MSLTQSMEETTCSGWNGAVYEQLTEGKYLTTLSLSCSPG